MIAALLARPWALKLAAVGAAVLAVALFLLNLRREGERAGRAAERAATQARTVEIQHAQLRAAADRPRNRSDVTRRMLDGEF